MPKKRSSPVSASPYKAYDCFPPDPIPKPTAPISFAEWLAIIRRERPEQENYYRLAAAVQHTGMITAGNKPISLIFVGPASCGKSELMEEMDAGPELCIRLDKFSAASLVTGSSNLSEAEAKAIDQLPKIRFRTAYCSDFNSIFGGTKETLKGFIGDLTRVQDGDGFIKATGNSPTRPYQGDYRFNLIGGSTPLSTDAWEVMAAAGPRFLFCHFRTRATDDHGIRSRKGHVAVADACKRLLLSHWWSTCWGTEKPRGFAVDFEKIPAELTVWLNRMSNLITLCRSYWKEIDGVWELQEEKPHRVRLHLASLMFGNCFVEERLELAKADLAPVAEVAMETGRGHLGHVVRALVRCRGRLSLDYFMAFRRMSESDSLQVLVKAAERGLGSMVTDSSRPGRPVQYLTVEGGKFAWLGSSEFRDLCWHDQELDAPEQGGETGQPAGAPTAPAAPISSGGAVSAPPAEAANPVSKPWW